MKGDYRVVSAVTGEEFAKLLGGDLIPVTVSAAERQAARMAEVPELYRKTYERLAVELSLNMEDAEAIFRRYGFAPDQAADLVESPAFITLLERVTKDVRENGASFRAKAKAISEDLLPYAYDIAIDPQQSAAVRADLIKWSAKVAGNEPKEKDEARGSGSGLTLSITFSGNQPQTIVSTNEPLLIEQEAS